MKDFKEVLYESLLYGFGKILAGYNTFAQESVLREVGREIIDYLNRNGFRFEETNSLNDIRRLIRMFTDHGFADLDVLPAEQGDLFKWSNLYGIQAYSELQEITENPFLSCPLNACLYTLAGKRGKTLKLHSKSFDLDAGIAYSQEEIVDAQQNNEEGFDSLVIENRRLLKIREEHEEALRNALAEVQRLASTDPLTELPNRRRFFELANLELQRVLRHGRSLAAIMLDIDWFKGVNDSFGHAAGDQVLSTVAKHCRETVRQIDVLGRIGGEEFAILLPETNLDSACRVAERLRRIIAGTPVETESGSVDITASFGVMTLDDTHATLDTLLAGADKALYQAKRDGRNRVCSA
jgi:diguanylate cyclase (GGDEF)-like protein